MRSWLTILLISIPSVSFGAIYTGSGFFITKDGYFVTNYHVIRDASEIQLRDIKGNIHKAQVIKTDKVNDLAILKAEGDFSCLPVANSRGIRRGTSVITIGYPHIDVQGLEPKVTEGIVNSLSGIGDDPRVFQISTPVQAGNSGGPLVTNEGNIIGIVVAKLSASTMFKETGDIPQNVNYAVKSNYLSEVIASIPELDQKLINTNKNALGSLANLTAYVEKATAIVIAEQPAKKSSEPIEEQTAPNPSNPPEISSNLKPIINLVKTGQFSSYGISIRAPDLAENGAVVPFEVTTSAPLVNGERLYLVVNDEYVSHIVIPQGRIEVRKFSVRCRMPMTGYLRGIVIDQSNKIRAASKEVQVKLGATMNSTEYGNSFSHKIRAAKNYSDAEIKILINSPMSGVNYLKNTTIKYGDTGNVVISMTPAASKNPYLGITTVASDYSNYGLEFTLSDGQKFTDSGEF